MILGVVPVHDERERDQACTQPLQYRFRAEHDRSKVCVMLRVATRCSGSHDPDVARRSFQMPV